MWACLDTGLLPAAVVVGGMTDSAWRLPGSCTRAACFQHSFPAVDRTALGRGSLLVNPPGCLRQRHSHRHSRARARSDMPVSMLDFRVSGKADRAGAYLDEILAFWFCDERLELWCCESVYEAGLGNDEEQNLGAGQDG